MAAFPGPGAGRHDGVQWQWCGLRCCLSALQVTRPSSYSRKSHFDFEEEDVDKLEIR